MTERVGCWQPQQATLSIRARTCFKNTKNNGVLSNMNDRGTLLWPLIPVTSLARHWHRKWHTRKGKTGKPIVLFLCIPSLLGTKTGSVECAHIKKWNKKLRYFCAGFLLFCMNQTHLHMYKLWNTNCVFWRIWILAKCFYYFNLNLALNNIKMNADN